VRLLVFNIIMYESLLRRSADAVVGLDTPEVIPVLVIAATHDLRLSVRTAAVINTGNIVRYGADVCVLDVLFDDTMTTASNTFQLVFFGYTSDTIAANRVADI